MPLPLKKSYFAPLTPKQQWDKSKALELTSKIRSIKEANEWDEMHTPFLPTHKGLQLKNLGSDPLNTHTPISPTIISVPQANRNT